MAALLWTTTKLDETGEIRVRRHGVCVKPLVPFGAKVRWLWHDWHFTVDPRGRG